MSNKVLVFSIALEGFEQTFIDCINTQVQYCSRFQYEYVLVKQAPPHRLSRDEAAWLKVPLIRAALNANYEWVAFLDADCEIRPHTPGFSEYLSSLSGNSTIFMASGFSGRINSGVIFSKNSPASLNFFDTIISNADFKVPTEDSVGWGENGHFIYYGKNDHTVYLLEHHLWNNNSSLDNHSYIQHYVTGPMREWYMSNRVLTKKNKALSKIFITKLFNRIQKKLGERSRRPDKPMIISESINELLPYYMKKYPVFCNASKK